MSDYTDDSATDTTVESKRIWDDPLPPVWTEEEIAEIQYAARQEEQ